MTWPVVFWNTQTLEETPDIRLRCNQNFLQTQLQKKHPSEELTVIDVSINETGCYQNPLANAFLEMFASGFSMEGLPPYCEVQLEHKTPGDHTAHITIWSPLAWNDRFLGTGGGGASTGGAASINQADDFSRGMTVPNAVANGFTSATTDAGNVSLMHDWALDPITNSLDWERIENWRARGTHWMTVFAKDVAEILHQRTVLFSYFHGSSGGGRQAMVEVQEFPEDYNGVWASSPAINWAKALLSGIWPIAVMNTYQQILSPEKLETFRLAVHASVGGSDIFYQNRQRVEFNPAEIIGKETAAGSITDLDALMMREIWDGPRRANGDQLWQGFRPGGLFWNTQGSPATAFFFEPSKITPLVFPFYARWVVQDPTRNFLDINKLGFEELFDLSMSLFAKSNGDSIKIEPFSQNGGKLIVDHGTDDPLIPVEGTLNYFNRLCQNFGGIKATEKFCRLYINPGDGHTGCTWHGPGITESVGMRSLIDWVEHNKVPGALHGIQINPVTMEIVNESELMPVSECIAPANY